MNAVRHLARPGCLQVRTCQKSGLYECNGHRDTEGVEGERSSRIRGKADNVRATATEAPKVSKVSVRRECAGNQNYGSEENVWNMWH